MSDKKTWDLFHDWEELDDKAHTYNRRTLIIIKNINNATAKRDINRFEECFTELKENLLALQDLFEQQQKLIDRTRAAMLDAGLLEDTEDD